MVSGKGGYKKWPNKWQYSVEQYATFGKERKRMMRGREPDEDTWRKMMIW